MRLVLGDSKTSTSPHPPARTLKILYMWRPSLGSVQMVSTLYSLRVTSLKQLGLWELWQNISCKDREELRSLGWPQSSSRVIWRSVPSRFPPTRTAVPKAALLAI